MKIVGDPFSAPTQRAQVSSYEMSFFHNFNPNSLVSQNNLNFDLLLRAFSHIPWSSSANEAAYHMTFSHPTQHTTFELQPAVPPPVHDRTSCYHVAEDPSTDEDCEMWLKAQEMTNTVNGPNDL